MPQPKPLTEEQRRALEARLRRAEGQVRSVLLAVAEVVGSVNARGEASFLRLWIASGALR